MFDTSVIEVVLGMVLVFSLISILVTQVNNLIARTINLRAKYLKQGIVDLVTDKYVQAKVLAHPNINMVDTTVVADANLSAEQAENIAAKKETEVVYIPNITFVEALMGILIMESDKDLFAPLQKAIRELENNKDTSQLRELIRRLRANFSEADIRRIYDIAESLADEKERDKLLTSLREVEEMIEQLYFKNDELVPLLDGIRRITDDGFRSAMQTILITARNLDEARAKLSQWYDDNMDRVSAAYKDRVQLYSLAVGCAIAVILNVDALFLARTLWNDDALRASVAAAAREFETPEMENAASGAALYGPHDPAIYAIMIAEETPEAPTATPSEDEDTLDDIIADAQEVDDTLQQLLDLNLPMGWQYVEITDAMIQESRALGISDPTENARNLWNFVPGNSDSWLWLWLQKLMGIAGTTLAIAQGAPFWFDILNRLTRRN